MSVDNAGQPVAAASNPFSPTAIAQVFEPDIGVVTIETDSVRRATRCLADYLTMTTTGEGPVHATVSGNIVAIIGDHGLGKTHLLMDLVRYARGAPGSTTFCICLDKTPDTFLALYLRFVQKLGLCAVRALVSECYADVVTASLQESWLTTDLAQSLRNRRVEPSDVVERLGLMESVLLPKVQQVLTEITGNESCGIALALLLRPGFDEAVWKWLRGGQPDPILVERGVVAAVDTEITALAAMGALVSLCGRIPHRLILMIDDVDTLWSRSNRPQSDTSTALRNLLTLCIGSGTFLVLAGSPDFLQVMPCDVRQLVSRVIVMSGLSSAQTCRLIEHLQQRSVDKKTLEPFTRETVDYIVRLTRGTARTVIRLCYHLHHQAAYGQTNVTAEMVRDVVREHLVPMSNSMVTAEVRRRLHTLRLAYHHNHLLGPALESLVDYWVPAGDSDAGCAVLITGSVLENGEVEDLIYRVSAVRRTAPDSKLLLVVNGILPDDLATRVSSIFSTDPVIYDSSSFAEEFDAALAAIVQRRQMSSLLEPLWREIGGIRRELRQLVDVVSSIEPGGVRRATGEPL
ncbi:MAG TPA: hypothetical protein VFQ77_18670 [Pseudonocardiaceae bacterium]|jgi:hypothetical protein|nr:hypothetical protein [Pseudonocardiaceae bacterium]